MYERGPWAAMVAIALVCGSCSLVNAPAEPAGATGGSGGQGGCASLDTVDSCGACGEICAPDNAADPSCAGGVCDYGACVGTFQDCDGDRTNGCESNKQDDPANCGGCGKSCDAMIYVENPTCKAGLCDYDTCQPGWADCDSDRSNGCETVATTLEQCSGCGVVCAPENADGPSCDGGICGYASCQAPFIDCDGDTANGCEIDGGSDPTNCGTCGNACGQGELCVAGTCSTALKSCRELLQANPGAQSGIHQIDPNGGPPGDAFDTYCDMTTDGGGWTLVLNRIVSSDNTGQPDLDVVHGVFDDSRATNWNFNINALWSDATEVVFAAKENADCPGCLITGYDSAIRAAKPAAPSWSKTCTSTSSAVNVLKLVGPSAGQSGTAYMCAATLGWGACSGSVCHYGVHSQSTSSDGSWSGNQYNEMHFPSQYSSYASYGDVNGPEGNAYCRSCAGGLPPTLNQSSTCCNQSTYNAKSRWTIWLR